MAQFIGMPKMATIFKRMAIGKSTNDGLPLDKRR
jgi:hypothetical protein